MNSLLSSHPEILTFKEDQMRVLPSVRAYVDGFVREFPKVVEQLGKFRNFYNQTDQISFDEVKRLYGLYGWTHTDTQHKSAVDFLRNISRKYPIPPSFRDKVVKGQGIDISQISDKTEFYSQLDSFVSEVGSLEQPGSIDQDLTEVGYLPISLVHKSGSVDYHDPLMEGKVNTVWTLDVSINPGLSIKDVIAKQMIDDAKASGQIKKNTILVEGTAGNTGTGIAIVAAVYGLKNILVIPDKMSPERVDRLRMLGAHTVVVPTSVAADDPKSYYSVRQYIAESVGGWQANQYDNLSNIKSHQEITGPMIWSQTRGEVTAVIGPAGTCGTISGVGRYLKEQNPDIKILAVDSVGSILYLLKEGYSIDEVQQYATGYKIQGFGEDIYPQNLDLSAVDDFIRIGDKTGLLVAQLLPSLGYINGQSSGAAYAGLIEAVDRKVIGNSDKVVTIFPDIGFTYRDDLYDDRWMQENGFLLETWEK